MFIMYLGYLIDEFEIRSRRR